jgi:hypothetical protein
MNYTKRFLMAIVMLGGFIFASPVTKTPVKPGSNSEAPLILVESACRSLIANPGVYTFVLDPVTEAYYGNLYFNFCSPLTGKVAYSIANSQSGVRTVQVSALTTYKVVISTGPLTKVNYGGPCSYTSLEGPGPVNASPLICVFQNCDAF